MATAQQSRQMELEGSLKVFKFPEILQFLASGGMTGILALNGEHRSVNLQFKEGKIIGSLSPDRQMRIGQMLVYAGHLSRQALEEALEDQTRHKSRFIGEILLDRQAVNAEQLAAVVKLQLEEEIWDLFCWETGSFHFEQTPVRQARPVAVELHVPDLLHEGAHRMEEWHAIMQNIGDADRVYRINPEFPSSLESVVDEKTWRVLALVNGRLSVDAIVHLSNLGKFQTYWALNALLRAEVIQPAEAPMKTPSALTPSRLTSPQAGPTPDDGDEQRRRDGARSSLIGGFFGKKKKGESEAQPDPDEEAAPAEIDGEYLTDVGLACAAVNRVLETAAGEFNAFEDMEKRIERSWWDAGQRFPKSDLIVMKNGRLQATNFERYVRAEGSLSRYLCGVHDDSLEALHWFADKVFKILEERMDEKSARELVTKAMRPFLKKQARWSEPEFSLSRWQPEGKTPAAQEE